MCNCMPSPESDFLRELKALINKHSMENGSDTPDFILAKFLEGCLFNFHSAVMKRSEWYKQEVPDA